MRSHPRAWRSVSLALLVTLTVIGPSAAAGPQAPLRAFSLGRGMTVAAPAPGFGVAASAVTVTGQHLDLVIETGLDGITRTVTEPPTLGMPTLGISAGSASAIAGSPSACSDAKYSLLPTMWKSTWQWRFQARSTPGELRRATAERHLKSAVASITHERNDCGRSDRVSATASYRGRTRTRPGIDNGCRKYDGKSVVGFGDLPAGMLGLTCTTYQVASQGVGRSVESDVLFNKDDFSWTTTLKGCHYRAMLRSIATHEFGHVFGLGHVSESHHGNLTMSTQISPCDDSAFTLGRGDMLGLERRY